MELLHWNNLCWRTALYGVTGAWCNLCDGLETEYCSPSAEWILWKMRQIGPFAAVFFSKFGAFFSLLWHQLCYWFHVSHMVFHESARNKTFYMKLAYLQKQNSDKCIYLFVWQGCRVTNKRLCSVLNIITQFCKFCWSLFMCEIHISVLNGLAVTYIII